jgi:hypothetical protein
MFMWIMTALTYTPSVEHNVEGISDHLAKLQSENLLQV